MARTFVIGDIHGAHRALLQCLERAAFNYFDDHLIALGDVSDGWPETRLCIDELLKIKHLIYLLGNHDFWTLEWMTSGKIDDVWYAQGGKATIESYDEHVPPSHIALLESAQHSYVFSNKLFVHAGINPKIPLEANSLHTLLWDRELARLAMELHQKQADTKLTTFDEVYIGHTPIQSSGPLKVCDIWMMDTGAGWSGILSMMNIETKEVFTSDPVPRLYPGVEGRKRR